MAIKRFNPDNPLAPSFPRRRESSGLCTPQSGQNPDIDPLRGDFFNNWISACAGMTGLGSNEQSRFKPPALVAQLQAQNNACTAVHRQATVRHQYPLPQAGGQGEGR